VTVAVTYQLDAGTEAERLLVVLLLRLPLLLRLRAQGHARDE
jgi:hypothetical protein